MKPNYERFGITEKVWEAAKAEARYILIEKAKSRSMITYGELASRMTSIKVEPYDMVLWEIIGDVSRDENQAGRGMLSVIVVHKNGDIEPGSGFYELAKALGRKTSDKMKCFIDELHRVHAEWSIAKHKAPIPAK